jgi:fructosamine-3-kinase
MGIGLARLHKTTQNTFGLHYDNYIGSLTQSNTPPADSWTEFFIHQRLEPMLKMAVDSGKAEPDLIPKFESLYSKLDEIFPQEKPALLHGDLWSGNCMADDNGDPVIYDPAVYYGHREMDLAMTKLFGGFESEFYEAYQEEFPLEKHWEQRIAICNLYPLLAHVNLFVGSYIQSIKNIINRY